MGISPQLHVQSTYFLLGTSISITLVIMRHPPHSLLQQDLPNTDQAEAFSAPFLKLFTFTSNRSQHLMTPTGHRSQLYFLKGRSFSAFSALPRNFGDHQWHRELYDFPGMGFLPAQPQRVPHAHGQESTRFWYRCAGLFCTGRPAKRGLKGEMIEWTNVARDCRVKVLRHKDIGRRQEMSSQCSCSHLRS